MKRTAMFLGLTALLASTAQAQGFRVDGFAVSGYPDLDNISIMYMTAVTQAGTPGVSKYEWTRLGNWANEAAGLASAGQAWLNSGCAPAIATGACNSMPLAADERCVYAQQQHIASGELYGIFQLELACRDSVPDRVYIKVGRGINLGSQCNGDNAVGTTVYVVELTVPELQTVIAGINAWNTPGPTYHFHGPILIK